MRSVLQSPSDFLFDNHKSLSKRRDFEDLCESLDNLQHEGMYLAFQDGFNQGELNILRQFVEGKLDRDYILKMFGDQLGVEDYLSNWSALVKSVQDIQLDVAEQAYLNG